MATNQMTTLLQRYVLEREIGRGASGTVWVGRDEQLGRHVAIKLLRDDRLKEPAAHEHFAREARTIAQLKSAHVVQVFDCGLDAGQPFIVMELLEGESLEQRLVRHPQLPLAAVARIVTDIARGLALTHRAGFVHCDLKPANIFLARESGREIAKLLDFGVAALLSARNKPSAAPAFIYGTPLYMSPERQFGDCSASADLWSLAVVAYEMLTGQCPFDHDTALSLPERMRTGHFKPPSQLRPELGAAVDAWFSRALAPDIAQRFKDPTELSADLTALAEDNQAPTSVGLLFIDDEPDMKLLLELKLQQQIESGQYVLYFALDGAAGLELLRQRDDIMVVMTDLNMPVMDGLTFLARVPEVNPLVRVVVVSAYGDMANIRAAMNQGAFDFLGKPIDFPDLERTIEKCLSHARELREALRSREENSLLRVLLGNRSVDRILEAHRAADGRECRSFEATVAYVDVANFSDHLQSVTPDQALAHLNAHFELYATELRARNGTISRFVGDGMLAIFEGEGHLRRAADACLAVAGRAREVGVGTVRGLIGVCEITIGIDTGNLIEGAAGSHAVGRIEHAVLGSAISTAAQLQSWARPQEILVTESVQRALDEAYVLESADERPLHPDAAPGRIHRIVGRRRIAPRDLEGADSTIALLNGERAATA